MREILAEDCAYIVLRSAAKGVRGLGKVVLERS